MSCPHPGADAGGGAAQFSPPTAEPARTPTSTSAGETPFLGLLLGWRRTVWAARAVCHSWDPLLQDGQSQLLGTPGSSWPPFPPCRCFLCGAASPALIPPSHRQDPRDPLGTLLSITGSGSSCPTRGSILILHISVLLERRRLRSPPLCSGVVHTSLRCNLSREGRGGSRLWLARHRWIITGG